MAKMQAAWSLYEAGDIVAARALAEGILAGAEPEPAERSAAEELLARTRFPKIAFLWGGIAAGVIFLMVLLATVRGR